jgi:hypothetical protein
MSAKELSALLGIPEGTPAVMPLFWGRVQVAQNAY